MDIVDQFTGFDWVVVSLVGLLAIVGLLRGFTQEALSLAGWILGIVAVRMFHQQVTLWLAPKVGGEASGAIIAFLLLYRFAEAQLVKMVAPFLLDPRAKGGLGLTTGEVGIVYGTVGVVALMLGGLLGGYVISKQGLKFWIWIMACAMHLPDLIFVYLSQVQPQSFWVVNLAVAVEQFGYGFGFTA